MQLDAGAGGGQPPGVFDVLVAEDVQCTDFQVRCGHPGEVRRTGRRRRRRHVHGADLVSEQGVPSGVVVVVGPEGEGGKRRIGCCSAVIEHWVDQDLAGHMQPRPEAALAEAVRLVPRLHARAERLWCITHELSLFQ
jgi:hypothetical protein